MVRHLRSDFAPEQPRPRNAEFQAVKRREHRWLLEQPDGPADEREATREQQMIEAVRRGADTWLGSGERTAIYEAIASAERARFVFPLIAALDARNGQFREAAVDALGRLQEKRGAAPVLAALHDKDPFVRVAAAAALPQVVAKEDALPALVEALRDEDDMVRARVAAQLGEQGESSAVAPLLALLRSEPPGSRPQRAAADALERLGAGQTRSSGRSPFGSPLLLWLAGLALFGLGVALAHAWGMSILAGAVGVAGFLLLVGFRLQAARAEGQWFFPGGELGASDAVWLGTTADGGGWSDAGGADGGPADVGGAGGDVGG